MQEVSGVDFATWDKRWRTHLASVSRDLPPELTPGSHISHIRELVKRVRVGELLDMRGHHKAAVLELSRAQKLLPTEASIRCSLAAALLGAGDQAGAAPLVETIDDVHNSYGRWWSLHGLLHTDHDPDRAFSFGIALDPLDPAVACEEKASPALPLDPLRAALCEAARRVPK